MSKIEKVIQIIKETMVANAPGTGGGLSSSANASGPVAGYDGFLGKRGNVDYRRVPKKYKDWVKNLDKSKTKKG
jgi:hypothetical protein